MKLTPTTTATKGLQYFTDRSVDRASVARNIR
jgi:hypothetical protein